MNATHDRAKSIFLSAAEIATPEERQKFVESECQDDEALRHEVDELLRHQKALGSFLESPVLSPPRSGEGPGEGFFAATTAQVIAERPGTLIGPYKLLQQIGEGGMGVVFMAEQSEPIQRTVALKIIKPGMDSRQVIARFEAERQAVAMMDHPNIAKVLDAGTTDTGRPYFVMELVKGVPLTEYCDQCNLTARERLELFVIVCQAVQHAHQQGIIHRDLKPTNVLVAMQDGQPAPKIIDFGVAKAIDQRLTEHTLTTNYVQMIGTPQYMSPEQAELSPLGVDTRSDIYSLGVLLYELLTGNTPFDKDRLHSAPFDELRRIIREEVPPRPSARISTLAADLATTVAEHLRTDARRLSQQVHGELDWIVMKCLEKDRNRRYETPTILAQDVERYLHDEPVQACPPSTIYRLRKYARRNKVALAFVTLLLGGFIYLAVSNIAIKRERDAKTAALADANAVSYLLGEMLASSYPDQVKDANYTVRDLLDEFSAKMSDHLAGKPDVEAAMREVISQGYFRLRILDRAELNLKKALDLRRQTLGDNDPCVADILFKYAETHAELGRIAEAETCVREALAICKKNNFEPRVMVAAADSYRFLALIQLQKRDAAGYRETCKSLIDLPVHNYLIVVNSRPVWTLCLAPDALDDMNRLVTRAEEYFAGNSQNQRHFALLVLGAALFRAGRYEQAAERLEQSIAAYPALPPHGVDSLNYQRLFLAMTKWQTGNRDEARRRFAEAKSAVNKELQAPSTLWDRRTTLELLRAEAEGLIEQKTANEAVESESRSSKEAKQ